MRIAPPTVLLLVLACFAVPALGQDHWLAIVGGTIFDGTGALHENAVVLVRNDVIEEVGPADQIKIPEVAQRLDARGKFVLPGFIDLHFHYSPRATPGMPAWSTNPTPPWLPLHFLAQGVTTLREMGNWISDNENWLEETRARGLAVPRLLYSGPLLDGTNPAYPHGSIVLLDELDGRHAASRLIDAGATSLKVYFRLPLSVMKAVIEEAHRRGVPVHGHLEVVEPRDAIALGLDGLEHTSSVGRALLPPRDSEAYRQMILQDSSARGAGRYEVWARVDPRGTRADELIRLMVERQVTLDATLGVYEPARGTRGLDEHWQAVRNMAAFTVRYHRAGGPVVIGSHGTVPNAAPGFAFHHEMKILVDAGLSPSEVLQAATRGGAVALGLDDRGVIAAGKLADLVILNANPLEDIDNATRVHAVVLDGRVVDRDALLAARPQKTGAR